ncbi:MAG: hypothetical protein ACXWW8_06595, partial [Solirubrobacterales bacterium]
MELGEPDRGSIRLAAALALVGAILALAAPAQGASGTWDRTWGKDVDSVAPGTGFEICTVAAICKVGSLAASLGGELNSPRDVATDAAGNIYVADTSNDRIQKFDSLGNFQRAWGRDVVSTGPGDTVAGGFEICVAASGAICKAAAASTGLGGELNRPRGVGTDAAGNVYVGDSDNNRIQKFDSFGAWDRAWGKDVVDNGVDNTGFEICV